jgi:hypothetical protein
MRQRKNGGNTARRKDGGTEEGRENTPALDKVRGEVTVDVRMIREHLYTMFSR